MISLVYIVKQKQTRKRERERESDQLGRSADQSSKLSSKKSRFTKETNTVTGQVLATEYS